jgi:hypothetical protein
MSWEHKDVRSDLLFIALLSAMAQATFSTSGLTLAMAFAV